MRHRAGEREAGERESLHGLTMRPSTHPLVQEPVPPSQLRITNPVNCDDILDEFFGDDHIHMPFTAGTQEDEEEVEIRRLVVAAEDLGIYDDIDEALAEEFDETVTNVVQGIRELGIIYYLLYLNVSLSCETGLVEESNAQDIQDQLNIPPNSDWFPYKNKTMFMLDMLDNLPRMWLSDLQLQAVLWVMKENKLKKQSGIPTTKYKSSQGNVFYVNDVVKQIAEDWANPLVCPYMQLYPEETPNRMSETWHGEKLCKEMCTDQLSPMVGVDNKHFYIEEIAKCRDGTYVYPVWWIFRNGELCGDVMEVRKRKGVYEVNERMKFEVHVLCSLLLLHTYIFANAYLDEDKDLKMFMEHPMHIKAAGRPIYVCFMILWGDDVSGNKSKQWNVHWNWYFAHAGVPKRLLAQEFFVRFASTSPHASNLEQVEAILEQIKGTHTEPIVTWDSELKQEIMLMISILHLPADNPMQSTLCSHIGYHLLFWPGIPRNAETTRLEITAQLEDTSASLSVEERQRNSGTKDSLTEPIIAEILNQRKILINEQTEKGNNHLDPVVSLSIKAQLRAWLEMQPVKMNPLLSVPGRSILKLFSDLFNNNITGLDPNRDTPTEPLHTVLLGTIKYIWACTCAEIVETSNLPIFEARLTSVNTDGLGIPPLRASYLVQYRGGLIGRQFKAPMQTIIFVIHDIVKPEIFSVWRAAGKVGALLWYPEIDDLEAYLIDILLDAMAVLDPSRIVQKPKFHILLHIAKDIRRFGPAILFSTEVFECFNAVFQMCSVLSNHQAPSCDIALKFSELDRFKHMVSGGYWKEKDEWITASTNVRMFFRHNPHLQAFLGWVEPAAIVPGFVKPPPWKNLQTFLWETTHGAAAIPIYMSTAARISDTALFEQCVYVISQAGDIAKPGHFVIYGQKGQRITQLVVSVKY
ncbi:hypothetical protein M422DRAFT_51154 [Sphaerobolus stellatus SS14]|uniref:Unplaced genomic scaffold SPHSTscaffold_105, whole genome shotgun sequence n=1 Tax=Sphaerobolus stellatus (strain SS14) TaxID=990650 RepID=A0A0C9V3B0_SPHS4|nr:hypothetical protein M422DRAFT_51154 [Sphaerobolus stellatus SS14]